MDKEEKKDRPLTWKDFWFIFMMGFIAGEAFTYFIIRFCEFVNQSGLE